MQHADDACVASFHGCAPHAADEPDAKHVSPPAAAVDACASDGGAVVSLFAGDLHDQTTWTPLVDCAVPETKRACFFCGVLHASNRRSLFLQDVHDILLRQEMYGVTEPVKICMLNLVCVARYMFTHTSGMHGEAVVNSCMCCYHWVARRQLQPVVRLPMQNLFWYVKNFDFHGRRDYDARMLHRLAVGITSKQGRRGLLNYYATLFTPEDLSTLNKVAAAPISSLHDIVAAHYYTQNNSPLFVVEASIMEAVRTTRRDQREDV